MAAAVHPRPRRRGDWRRRPPPRRGAGRPYVRPMASPEKFEEKVALTGVGMSKVGRHLGVDPLSLTIDACRKAVADAGLTMADIDGLSTYPGGGIPSGFSEGGITAVEESLRIRPTWFNSGLELPGQGGSVIAAAMSESEQVLSTRSRACSL